MRFAGHRTRRAALILEVIIALTVFVLASGLLAAELVNGMQLTGRADAQMRANQLADRMLALLELDPNLTAQLSQELQTHGDFGKSYPRWFWRATVEPLQNVDGLGLVSLELLYQGDPNDPENYETAGVVRHLHVLKAAPGRVDLAKDFGVDQEAVDALSQSLPIAGIDPTALDPQAIAALDPQTLLAILPTLMQLLPQLSGGNFSPDMLASLMGGMGGGGAGGSQQDAIMALIKQQLGDQISDEQLQQIMNGLGQGGGGQFGGGPGGGRGGGGRGGQGNNGNGGDNPEQQAIREMLRSSLAGQISDAELDQMINNIGRGGGGFAPPPGFNPQQGGANGGQGGPPRRGGGGPGGRGQTINQINQTRDVANPGKKSSG